MPTVGYLVPSPRPPTGEERAGWNFLRRAQGVHAVRVTAADRYIPRLLWCHTDRLQAPPDAFIAFLRSHLDRGGSLLLSLLATRFVVDLGLEDRPPDVIRSGRRPDPPWTAQYPDIRGFGGYRGHPVFRDLGGGAYTWAAGREARCAAAWYEGSHRPPRGKIIAVERQYIRLLETRCIALEYRHGPGRTITLGAHICFAAEENRFRPHLEHFVGNCLRYLDPDSRKGRRAYPRPTWWPGGSPSCTLLTDVPTRSTVGAGHPGKWTGATGLVLTRSRAGRNAFDVGGRRLLMAGSERRGLTEVWAHPVRILSDLRWRMERRDRTILTSWGGRPAIAVTPEAVRREFSGRTERVVETSMASVGQPAGLLRLDVALKRSAALTVSGRIDLRLMWPLSDRATGDLQCWWDGGLQAAVVRNFDGQAAAVLGMRPVPTSVSLEPHRFTERRRGRAGNAHVEFTLTLRLGRGQHTVLIAMAGSGRGLPEATRAYARVLSAPDSLHRGQVASISGALRNAEPAAPTDPTLRDAYRWGVASLCRFFVSTPGLGASLMAGFGDTRRGWNGGHRISGRPGYAWYFGRDSVWSALALLSCGQPGLVRHVLKFLGRHQDITGKVAHEITTSGHAHFDAADATPLYVLLMGRYLRTTGDRAFCRGEYERLRRAVEFSAATDRDGDGFIENTGVGHGWIEGGALFPAHAELYLNACWAAALGEAAHVAARLGRNADHTRWNRLAALTWRRIWKSFPDARTGFPAFALRKNGRMWREETALAAVAVLLGDPPRRVTDAVLRRLADASFLTPRGVRMVAQGSSTYDPRGYHTGSIWPLFTGWAALAAVEQGRVDLAGEFLKSNSPLHRLFSLGHVPEVLHGDKNMSAGVCDHQAWSAAMVVLPAAALAREARRRQTESP